MGRRVDSNRLTQRALDFHLMAIVAGLKMRICFNIGRVFFGDQKWIEIDFVTISSKFQVKTADQLVIAFGLARFREALIRPFGKSTRTFMNRK